MNRNLVVALIMIVIAGVLWVAYAPSEVTAETPYSETVRVDNDTLPPTFPSSPDWRGSYKYRTSMNGYEWDEPYMVLFSEITSEVADEINLGFHDSDDMPLWDDEMMIFVNETAAVGPIVYIYYIVD